MSIGPFSHLLHVIGSIATLNGVFLQHWVRSVLFATSKSLLLVAWAYIVVFICYAFLICHHGHTLVPLLVLWWSDKICHNSTINLLWQSQVVCDQFELRQDSCLAFPLLFRVELPRLRYMLHTLWYRKSVPLFGIPLHCCHTILRVLRLFRLPSRVWRNNILSRQLRQWEKVVTILSLHARQLLLADAGQMLAIIAALHKIRRQVMVHVMLLHYVSNPVLRTAICCHNLLKLTELLTDWTGGRRSGQIRFIWSWLLV